MNLFLEQLGAGRDLDEQAMAEAIGTIIDGHAPDHDIRTFLTLLHEKGETAQEITGAASALRARVRRISAPEDAMDCCGTGGDSSGTYNISTTVAIVAASCGVPIAKHGNRASSSRSGSADILEALGVNLDLPLDRLELALQKMNFAFLMATHHHKALKTVSEIRKSIGFRTIFNLLGPLANPALTTRQLIGVYDRKWLEPFAQTLKSLGSRRAWIVHGSDGLDEITLTGPTWIASLEQDGAVREFEINPEDFGFNPCAPDALKGGDADENAEALKDILKGKHGAYRNVVIANTAATLLIHGSVPDLAAGRERAEHAIDSGRATALLNDYILFSQQKDF